MAPGAPHLAGVTVLDLSSVGPASRASRILADYGADVIKVGPTSAKGGVQIQPPFYSYGAGRGMKRLRVDLKSPEGKAASASASPKATFRSASSRTPRLSRRSRADLHSDTQAARAIPGQCPIGVDSSVDAGFDAGWDAEVDATIGPGLCPFVPLMRGNPAELVVESKEKILRAPEEVAPFVTKRELLAVLGFLANRAI